MARVGWYLLMFGAGSALLSMFGREFTILMWIDSWGVTMGWVIRGLLVAAGAFLTLRGSQERRPHASHAVDHPR